MHPEEYTPDGSAGLKPVGDGLELFWTALSSCHVKAVCKKSPVLTGIDCLDYCNYQTVLSAI